MDRDLFKYQSQWIDTDLDGNNKVAQGRPISSPLCGEGAARRLVWRPGASLVPTFYVG